jgi:hypothetical protein
MYVFEPDLRELKARARRGDPTALAALRQQLLAYLIRVVRREVRAGPRPSLVSRQVHAHMSRLAPAGRDRWDDEQLIAQAAQSLCESVIADLQAPPVGNAVKDTVRM